MGIKMKLRGLFASALLALTMAAPTQSFALTNALVLSMDGSGSISSANYTLQVDAYVSALNTVFGGGSLYGTTAIGINIFGANVVDGNWAMQVIDDAADLAALTAAIAATDPGRDGVQTFSTRIDLAIVDAEAQINANALFSNATNKVIDVSTDGFSAGDPVGAANAALANSGITTNCLGIGANARCNFETGFEVLAADFAAFEAALITKLQRELNVPEPGIAALMAMGLLGIGFIRRRKA